MSERQQRGTWGDLVAHPLMIRCHLPLRGRQAAEHVLQSRECTVMLAHHNRHAEEREEGDERRCESRTAFSVQRRAVPGIKRVQS